MQQPGGLLRPPVQKLVAALLFAIGEKAIESLILSRINSGVRTSEVHAKATQKGGFSYWQRRDSNQFRCNSPAGCCCHQFKNRWLPYFSPKAKRQSNPSSNPPSRQRNWNLWGCPKPPLCKGRWQKSIDFCRRGCPDKCQSPSQLR